ncbi:MAG: hypothetical protein RLN96_02025 [Pseudomonadales bacterium]
MELRSLLKKAVEELAAGLEVSVAMGLLNPKYINEATMALL